MLSTITVLGASARGLLALLLLTSLNCNPLEPDPNLPTGTGGGGTGGGTGGGGTGGGTGGGGTGGGTGGGGAAVPVLIGTIRDSAGSTVPSGTIQVLRGATTAKLIPISTGGTYVDSTLPAGTYDLRYHPPGGFSVGTTDGGAATVTLTTGTTTQNFTASRALFYDDFQSYTDSADLLANFPKAYKSTMVAFIGTPSGVTIDPVGGPNGLSKAMRYNIPARPGNCTNLTVNVQPYWRTNVNIQVDSVWFRFVSRESPSFSNGSATCPGGRSYKFFLAEIGLTASAAGRLGSYILNADNAQDFYMDVTDRTNFNFGSKPLGANTAWSGQWAVWLVHITGIGTTNMTYEIYREGVLVNRITSIYRALPDPKRLVSFELGANINHGPDTRQIRWFREAGAYRTRPSTFTMAGVPLP